MSIIKSIKQVLGLGPAAENHFWDGSVANQLTLKRGTPDAPGAEVLLIKNGAVSPMQNPMFYAWRNGNQAGIASNANIDIIFNSVDLDTCAGFNPATGRWTPNKPGMYQFNWTVTGSGLTADQAMVASLAKNGVTAVAGSASRPSPNVFPISAGSSLLYMNGTTDSIGVTGYGDSTGTWTVVGAQSFRTVFSGFLVRDFQ